MNKKQLIVGWAMVSILLVCLYGCKSIVVGGTGEVGGVRGRGSVTVPIPNPGK
ncbi:hypothetical protein ACFL4C_00610 [Candidatus Omnitrophota bacterium]